MEKRSLHVDHNRQDRRLAMRRKLFAIILIIEERRSSSHTENFSGCVAKEHQADRAVANDISQTQGQLVARRSPELMQSCT